MTRKETEETISAFLGDHPEHAGEVGFDDVMGPLLTSRGVELFAAWAVRTGRTTDKKAQKVMVEIKKTIARAVESN